MEFSKFGDVAIFRPSLAAEIFVTGRARTNLLSRFRPGVYRGVDLANTIIQHQFRFYDRLLQASIPALKSTDAAQFLLSQFDDACEILHGQSIKEPGEREAWTRIEPLFKRGIKYLVELLSGKAPNPTDRISRADSVVALESALICAESMAQFAQESDLAHSVFPSDCVVEISEYGPLHMRMRIEGPHADYAEKFWTRVVRDRQSRYDFTGFPQFDNDTAKHQAYLDAGFSESFDMSYGEFLAAIRAVIEGCRPSPHRRAFKSLLVSRRTIVESLADSGRNRAAIELALEGFTICPTKMAAEKRVIWRPKQENRAYRRGFYLFELPTGSHLAFSRSMAQENFIQLVSWVCYRHLPPEWDTPVTNKALCELSTASGNWFEDVVRRNLTSLGISGYRCGRTVGTGVSKQRIPDKVGEIDFLGIHKAGNLLVIAEAKMVVTGMDACYWRDDLDEFVFRTDSYAERFRVKIAWLVENRVAVAKTFGHESSPSIAPVMISLYPCIARSFIRDFQCVSLAEFMFDYKQNSCWPYAVV